MSEDSEILVDEAADAVVGSLAKKAPAAPSEASMESVSGPSKSAGAQRYREQMSKFAKEARYEFVKLLELVRLDSENGLAAIADFRRQDEEIMLLLRRFDDEVVAQGLGHEQGSTQPRGTDTDAGAGADEEAW
ncbi:hypothetical protein ACFSWE_12115 [Leucobacter albus]|uniref:Uncharacterized protein n=1 Tax=Leucobacter albus TaxID=272210 RepID=A0ABW3TL90_9MICO